MTLVVGTDSYLSLDAADTYHSNRGNSVWTAYIQTITTIVTHVDGIKITSLAHGLGVGDQVRLRQTTNYDGTYIVVTVVDADNFTVAAAYVADESSGIVNTEATALTHEQALRVATDWINRQGRWKWKGLDADPTTRFPWPRWGVYDQNGYIVDGIPADLEDACAIMALRHLSGDDINADLDAGGRVVREKIGPLETEWSKYGPREKQYTEALSLVAPYVEGGLSKGVVKISRA